MPARAQPIAPLTTTEMPRRERRKREVHDRILRAAVELFEKQGPRETKIDHICERADVAQKTFFNHFATKQHLVSELASSFMDTLFVTIDELGSEAESAGDRLRLFFRRVADRCDEAGPMHRELILEVIRVAYLHHDDAEQARVLHDAFRKFLEDNRSELRPGYDIEVLTEMVVGAYYVLMLNWVSLDNYPLHERAAAAGEFLANSITSR